MPMQTKQHKPFGIYVHIPFCIQRCSYCDFATYSQDQISPNQEYVEALLLEAQKRRNIFSQTKLDTLYFGGGTPSLLEPVQIKQIIDGIYDLGFEFSSDIEITLEVNPATLNEEKCIDLKKAGVNRLSIGCQSFDDQFLKICNREHNTQDTLNTVFLAQKYFDNYSLDLLFSLPKQGLGQLESDLKQISQLNPPHVSAYCLTLPEQHPMNSGRCSDSEQVKMFELIHNSLEKLELEQYEISNFAKSGFQSQHNNLYWTDANYWGIGLSAHSYKNDQWGIRFWNPSTYQGYMKMVQELSETSLISSSFSEKNYETLAKHESLTDFCHTHLRLQKGLPLALVHQKFGNSAANCTQKRLQSLSEKNLLINEQDQWRLSDQGLLLSNLVFSELLFSESDIDISKA